MFTREDWDTVSFRGASSMWTSRDTEAGLPSFLSRSLTLAATFLRLGVPPETVRLRCAIGGLPSSLLSEVVRCHGLPSWPLGGVATRVRRGVTERVKLDDDLNVLGPLSAEGAGSKPPALPSNCSPCFRGNRERSLLLPIEILSLAVKRLVLRTLSGVPLPGGFGDLERERLLRSEKDLLRPLPLWNLLG